MNEENSLNCRFCNKLCKNSNSLKQHEKRCSKNINKIPLSKVCLKGHPNYGNAYTKAKELGLPKPEVSKETRDKLSKAGLGRKWSDEGKKKISESCKKYYSEHPDKVGFVLNHSSKKSYPEQYFEELFIKEGIDLKYHLRVDRYELDFYNLEKRKYVEIDGSQHNSQYMINHDKERKEYLESIGWDGIRISWENYQKLSYEDKHNVVEYIKNFVSTESSYISQSNIENIYISYKDKKDSIRKEKQNRRIEIHNYKRLIIIKCCETSKIDFTKYGWLEKMKQWLNENTNISFKNVSKAIKRYYPEFVEIYHPFVRKSVKYK